MEAKAGGVMELEAVGREAVVIFEAIPVSEQSQLIGQVVGSHVARPHLSSMSLFKVCQDAHQGVEVRAIKVHNVWAVPLSLLNRHTSSLDGSIEAMRLFRSSRSRKKGREK